MVFLNSVLFIICFDTSYSLLWVYGVFFCLNTILLNSQYKKPLIHFTLD